jgi:RHS repeat-associated protein
MAQKVGSAGQSYHLLDTHSDVVGLVSTAAANQGTASFDAYGGVLGASGTQGLLGYQGDVTDPITKQVDMGTRWYAPGQGRFTSRDVLFGKLSSPMTLNQFAYAGENPITMWDPTGMGQCTMAGECQDEEGNPVGGNVSGEDSPYSGCHCVISPAPPPPQPAPAIVYNREAGTYAVPSDGGCVRRCGTDTFANFDWGEGVLLGGDGGGCGFLGLGCVGEVLTFAKNLPVTTTAIGIAIATGHSCRLEPRLQIGCYGNDPTGASHEVTWGNMFVTNNQSRFLDDAKRSHEYRHAEQWAWLPGFPVAYSAAYATSRWVLTDGTQCANPFEADAGFAAGGYDECVG